MVGITNKYRTKLQFDENYVLESLTNVKQKLQFDGNYGLESLTNSDHKLQFDENDSAGNN